MTELNDEGKNLPTEIRTLDGKRGKNVMIGQVGSSRLIVRGNKAK